MADTRPGHLKRIGVASLIVCACPVAYLRHAPPPLSRAPTSIDGFLEPATIDIFALGRSSRP